MSFGPHLILEAYDCCKEILSNHDILYNFLDNLPSQINMTKIIQPQIIKYSESPDPRWGYSGFVIIAESHIAFHGYPEDYFVTVDIFSCKNFDEFKTLQILKNFFQFSEYEHHIFKRGTHYPTNNKYVTEIINIERMATTSRSIDV